MAGLVVIYIVVPQPKAFGTPVETTIVHLKAFAREGTCMSLRFNDEE